VFPHEPKRIPSSDAYAGVAGHLLGNGLLLYVLLGIRLHLGEGAPDLFSIPRCLVWAVLSSQV